MKMSAHAMNDRMERLTMIVDTIGIGEVLFEYHNEYRHSIEKITDTGVVIICDDTDRNKLITAYVMTMDRAKILYHYANRHMTTNMYYRIKANAKYAMI